MFAQKVEFTMRERIEKGMKTALLNDFRFISGAMLLLGLLTGCGTTSGLRQPAGATQAALTPYDRVVVRDFADRVSSTAPPEYQDQAREAMQDVTKSFSDTIAEEIRKTGVFQEVTRQATTAAPSTIAVTGDITRYEKGRGALRMFVGHGAGRSEFDAVVELRDAESNKLLGTLVVDRNSWPLPGAVGASQTPDTFMKGAAKKIASELQKAKTGLPTGRTGP
jgi:hypothetical protein